MNREEFESAFCKNGWVSVPLDLWNKLCGIMAGSDECTDETYYALEYIFKEINNLQ